MANKEFFTERMLDKQLGKTGKVDYFLKWRGSPYNDNDWKKKVARSGERLRGFEQRLDSEKNVSATNFSGNFMFLIK